MTLWHTHPTGGDGPGPVGPPRRARGPLALVVAVLVTAALCALALPSGAEPVDASTTTTSTTGTSTTAVPTTSTSTTTTAATATSAPTTSTPPEAPSPTTATTTAPAAAPSTTTAPADAPPGAAGVASLPAQVAPPATPSAPSVTVTPASGLVQGTPVTVSGSGFPAGDTIGVIQCRANSSSVDDCNLTTLAYASADATGHFSLTYSPRRILTVGGTGIDCAGVDACKIGAGSVADQSQTADAPIRFDPTVPPPPPPSLAVTPSTLLLDGQTVTVTGTGYIPNRSIGVIQCPDPALTSGANCAFPTLRFVTTDAAGSFTTTLTVTRIIRANGQTTDCAELGACLIGAGTGAIEEGANASIRFDPSVPPPPPPVATVTPSTDLLDGQTVTVSGTHFTANSRVAVNQCVDPAATTSLTCSPFTYADAPTDASGSFSVTIPVRRIVRSFEGRTDCAGPTTCVIAVGSYTPGEVVVPIAFDASVPPPPPPTIAVSPSTDLLDGDTVHVTGSGFDPGAPVALSQCPAGPEVPGGCGGSSAVRAVDPDGTFAADLVVDRITYRPDGTAVDCADPDACVVSAFDYRFGQTAASAPIGFDPSVPPPPPPSIAVTPSQDLADGQLVTVTGTGFPRQRSVGVVQCRTGSDAAGCDLSDLHFVQTGTDGTFTLDLEAHRYLQVDVGRVDCAEADACRIGAGLPPSGTVGADAPIRFDPDAPPPPPATLTVTPGAPYRDGQLVTVSGTGFPYGRTVAVVQCRPGGGEPGCDLSNVVYVQPDRSRSFTVQFRLQGTIRVDVGSLDCGTPGVCELAAGTLPDGATNAIVDLVVGGDGSAPTTPTTTPGADVESATAGRSPSASGGSGTGRATRSVTPAFTG